MTLIKLKSISMSFNSIERLKTSSFANLPEIENITLDHMPRLKVIEKYAFVNLPKLKYLSLSNNPYLIHVGGKSFGHTIPGIQILKLSNNAIDLLPEELKKSLPKLKSLDLTGNPLNCNCHLDWIKVNRASSISR